MERVTVWVALLAVVGGSKGEWPGYGESGADPYVLAYLNATWVDAVTREQLSVKEEVGKFGEGAVGPAWGVLAAVQTAGGDPTACTMPLVSRHSDKLPAGQPWVALVRRGRCNFDVKVENAYRSNASAVIVYNDKDFSTLEKMRLETRNISAVFTTKKKGEEWLRLLDNGTRVYMYITVGRQGTLPYPSLNRSEVFLFPRLNICDPRLPAGSCVHLTSVLFVSISFIVLMVISLAWLVFYYVQRFQYIHAKDRLSKRLSNAAKKALSKIPTKNLKAGDRELQGDGECCAVCIEPYKVSDILRILPCGHEFHKSCIDPWLLEHRTCPMCKMDILKHYGFVFTGSQESILHMDIEEVVSPDNLEAMQHRGVSAQTPSMHQGVVTSPESRSSRASTPSPCGEQYFLPGTSRTAESRDCSAKSSTGSAAEDGCTDVRDCELESCSSTPSHRPVSASTPRRSKRC